MNRNIKRKIIRYSILILLVFSIIVLSIYIVNNAADKTEREPIPSQEIKIPSDNSGLPGVELIEPTPTPMFEEINELSASEYKNFEDTIDNLIEETK